MHPLTWPLMIALCITMLVQYGSTCSRTLPGKISYASNWWWSGSWHCFGIGYSNTPGIPPCPEDGIPNGYRAHRHLQIGLMLFTLHFTWFGNVPPAE